MKTGQKNTDNKWFSVKHHQEATKDRLKKFFNSSVTLCAMFSCGFIVRGIRTLPQKLAQPKSDLKGVKTPPSEKFEGIFFHLFNLSNP